VVAHSDKATCQGILDEAVPHDATMVYSDEYRSYHGLDLPHATVNHGQDRGDTARHLPAGKLELDAIGNPPNRTFPVSMGTIFNYGYSTAFPHWVGPCGTNIVIPLPPLVGVCANH
jgi:hypothetical protein